MMICNMKIKSMKKFFLKYDCDHLKRLLLAPLLLLITSCSTQQVNQPVIERKTGLWLKGLPKLEPTNLIDINHLPPKQRQRLHWLPPSKNRWKLRSLTYLGVAQAMADQWSNY